jgi:hypothetical protein
LVEDHVSLVDGDHVFVNALQLILLNEILVLLIVRTNITLLVHDSETLDLLKRALKLHLISELVLKEVSIDFAHSAKASLSNHSG